MIGLTANQERVWRFIKGCERSPTGQEMIDALGLSAATIDGIINALRERGYVVGPRGKQRALVAIDPSILSRIPTKLLLEELGRRAA